MEVTDLLGLADRITDWRVKRKVHFGNNCQVLHGCQFVSGEYMFFGDNANIGRYVFFGCYDEKVGGCLNPLLKVGHTFLIGSYSKISVSKGVTIGDNVTVASNVFICDSNHGTSALTDNYLQNPLSNEEIYIGDGVWIGEKVIILSGASIGKKSIIGAGSVVTKSIPEYCMAVGNPCKVIKRWNGIEWVSTEKAE